MILLTPVAMEIGWPILCLEICIYLLVLNRSDGLSILLTSDSFYPPKGGGDISLRTLARRLSNSGHEITIVYSGEVDSEFRSVIISDSSLVRGLWPRHMYIRRHFETGLQEVISELNPDVAVTQQLALSPTIDVCHKFRVPVVALLRGVDVFCLGSFWSGTEKRCDYRCIGCEDAGSRIMQFPIFRREMGRIRNSLRLADAIVSNSEYTRQALKSIIGTDSQVLKPPIDRPSTEHRATGQGHVLFVSPVKHKGVEIAIEMSRRLKDQKFVFVGMAKRSTIRRFSRLSNVEYIPWASDMASLYLASKLLIVPSLIPEGYGRVCAEAQSYGVPCVVSPVGALPEVTGEAGDVVRNHLNVASWIDIIDRYSDPEYFRQKSLNALENASGFSTHDEHAAEMEALIEDVVHGSSIGLTDNVVDDF